MGAGSAELACEAETRRKLDDYRLLLSGARSRDATVRPLGGDRVTRVEPLEKRPEKVPSPSCPVRIP